MFSQRRLETEERELLRNEESPTPEEFAECHDEKCISEAPPPPAIVQIYNCERDTFRLSVYPLCGALRDPREAVLVSAGRTVYYQRTDNPFCRDGVTDNP